jgi:nucleotide-binding universal stress UspA family protein
MMAKRILVPLGAGIEADAIVPLVGAIARASGATVRLLHVSPIPKARLGAPGQLAATAPQLMEQIGERAGADLRATGESMLHGVSVETAVRFGDFVEEILVEADAFDADLIAVAGGPAGRLERFLAPAAADRVLARSPVPVLLLGAGRP